MKIRFTNEQLRALIRPMFTSSIMFGYTTAKKVDKMLNKYLK